MGAAAAVAVGEGLGAELAVGAEEPAGVAFLRSINSAACPIVISSAMTAIEYMEPCLFLTGAPDVSAPS